MIYFYKFIPFCSMDCLSPRYITNRTLHYDLFKPLKIAVPCGKCEACKKHNRDDWFIRSVYEWKDCGNKNSFFYTLTFNNEHLPRYNGIPCFNKEVIQKFLKRLRYRLTSHHITMKYMVVCEFGELRQRPHHHVDFFLRKEDGSDVNPYWFYRFVQDSWVDKNGKSLGFIMPGDNCGLINSYAGIQYVTKYISKDFSHLDLVLPYFAPTVFKRYYNLYNYVCRRYHKFPQVSFKMNQDYSFSRQVFGSCSQDDFDLVQKFLTKMRRIINDIVPFHLQSSHFGMSIKDLPSLSDDMIPHVDAHQRIVNYRVPRYYKRLLWYDCFENCRDGKRTDFKLNDLGKKHIIERLDSNIAFEKQKIEYVTLNANVSKIDPGLIPFLKEKGYGFQDVRDLVSYFGRLSLNTDVLAIYSAIFRGRVVCSEWMKTDLNCDFILHHYKDIVLDSLYGVSNFDFGEICKNRDLLHRLEYNTWNYHPFFLVYEDTLKLLEMVYLYHEHGASDASVKLESKVRKLRQIFSLVV